MRRTSSAFYIIMFIAFVFASPVRAKTDFNPSDCPTFGICDAHGCRRPDPSTPTFFYKGLTLPKNNTNFPVINAGIAYLAEGSRTYLDAALGVVCGPRRLREVDCALAIATGQRSNSELDDFAQPIWPVGVGEAVLAPKILEKGSMQLELCRSYAQSNLYIALTLAPKIALQTHVLSEEGMKIRRNIQLALVNRTTTEDRCRREMSTGDATEKQCANLRAFVDDVTFALLLADKLAARDLEMGRSWELLHAADHAILQLGLLGIWTQTREKHGPKNFGEALERTLAAGSNMIRFAIQEAL